MAEIELTEAERALNLARLLENVELATDRMRRQGYEISDDLEPDAGLLVIPAEAVLLRTILRRALLAEQERDRLRAVVRLADDVRCAWESEGSVAPAMARLMQGLCNLVLSGPQHEEPADA